MLKKETRCGTIAIVGRPNVGKSTLLNRILGQKLSITSVKPQTTRQQIQGIRTSENVQWVYFDTPGLKQVSRHRLNRTLIQATTQALSEADVVAFVVEANRWTSEEDAILMRLKEQKTPVILVINKVDRVKDKAQLLPYLRACSDKMPFLALLPVSAWKGDNILALEETIAAFLPLAEFTYPPEQRTQHSERFLAAEFIREKLMRNLYNELPYGLTVAIEQFLEQTKIIKIKAIIHIERLGQKAIIIGKKGELLKKIGSEARRDMEQCFGKKVYLNLWVKVLHKAEQRD